jgi:hypothetical protein
VCLKELTDCSSIPLAVVTARICGANFLAAWFRLVSQTIKVTGKKEYDFISAAVSF